VDLVNDDAGKVLEVEARAFPGAKEGQLLGSVRRMSGGRTFCLWRRATPVSPVRLSAVMSSPISRIGRARLRSTSTARALSGEI
jgi:hypothetical protein